MATFSIRIPDPLKRRVAEVARKQGVSMNNFVVSAVASAAAQQEAMDFFMERLAGKDRETVHKRFEGVMAKSRRGKAPSAAQIDRLLGC